MHGAGATAATAATAPPPMTITSAAQSSPTENRIPRPFPLPPPSYAEAMAQSNVPVKNNAGTLHLPPPLHPHLGLGRDERYPQVPGYSQPTPGHSEPSHFYPSVLVPPATCDPSNAQNPSHQQNSAAAPIHCILHTEHVVHRKRRTDRASNKIIWAAMLGILIMIVVIRTILVRSRV